MFDNPRTLILAVIMFALIMAPLLYFFRAVVRFSRSLEVIDARPDLNGSQLRAPAISYGLVTVLPIPFAEALRQTKAALHEDGLGVVAEIDVADVLADSGLTFEAYTILVAWDATTMYHALRSEQTVGLLWPAHVIVFEVAGGTVVAAMDPRRWVDLAHNPRLLPIAVEARAQLQRAIDRLEVSQVPN
jgi:uncharacterized protein (DUF302 family)